MGYFVQYTCMSFNLKALAAAILQLCWSNIMALLCEVMLWQLLWWLHQVERGCYGCCASQESINVSAVPMAPQVFFQPLSSRLAYPEFNKQCEQCEQQDNWRCEQDEKQYSCYKEGSLLSLGAPFLVLLTP